MKKKVLPFIAGVLLAGGVSAQDLFSWYSIESSGTPVCESGSYSLEGVGFGEVKTAFVDNYTDVFSDRVTDSPVGLYRDLFKDFDFNYEKSMYRSLVTTCVERYEIAQMFQGWVDWARDKTTVKTRLTSKKTSQKRALNLLIRPSVRSGVNFTKWGAEFTVRDVNKKSFGSLRFYSDHAEAVLPLRQLLVREGWYGLDSRNVPGISVRARSTYDGRFSVFSGYDFKF